MEEKLTQRHSNCIKVVLFGPESTGKTTLAKQLAQHFQTEWVPEYMREYLQKKWDESKEICAIEDLIPIAEGQMQAENCAATRVNELLICDTNLLELKVYSEYYYDGYCPKPIAEASEANNYDLYLLTNIDVPWEFDDLRDRPDDRSTLFRIFEAELKKGRTPYHIISGSKQERFDLAVNLIQKLLSK
ncbi:AAA family ATPase [Candidatus Ulvibacter alkanivorans]|uniref:AAA family ATPase n=1 Tax=Candidatus Ulvibacter alkanivorans TaxID=2267620 RepID=UPI000DF3F685|nr:ATP-binding protein [Candidatus Ulvibacter alkanivorans]